MIAALTLAGLPTDRFAFFGFLPAKAGAKASAIAEAAGFRGTVAYYESGPRLAAFVHVPLVGRNSLVTANDLMRAGTRVLAAL